MSTIYDVAERAGVAPVTVSRVINGSGYVSDETRLRVETAIVDLGYRPNRLAQGLRSKQTETIALVVTDITNPFWTTVARGAEDAASQAGFSLILCNTDESEAKQDHYVHLLLQKQVDGFLLVPASITSDSNDVASIREIQRRGVPVVLIDRKLPIPVDCVRCDSEAGAHDLVMHLIERGYTRIAALSGSREVSTARDRVNGYRRALAEAGLDVDDALVFNRAFTQDAGYAMATAALATVPRPTALFAVNNFIAIGALRAVRDAGLRVPEDIALVGFDDLPPSLVVEAYLTVVSQPAYEMGERATQLLLDRLSGVLDPEPREIILPTELIVRRSSDPGKSEMVV